MKFKGKALAASLIGILSMGLANAGDHGWHSLHVNNKSPYDLSFSIDGQCSDKFGVINAHTQKKLSAFTLHRICKTCTVMIHDSKDCTKNIIGGFLLVPSTYNVVEDVQSYKIGLVVGGGLGMLDIEQL